MVKCLEQQLLEIGNLHLVYNMVVCCYCNTFGSGFVDGTKYQCYLTHWSSKGLAKFEYSTCGSSFLIKFNKCPHIENRNCNFDMCSFFKEMNNAQGIYSCYTIIITYNFIQSVILRCIPFIFKSMYWWVQTMKSTSYYWMISRIGWRNIRVKLSTS